MIQAIICTIGDEILIGQILDTNSAFIAKELNQNGIKVSSILSIGDSRCDIVESLQRCMQQADVVIITGGLGPTKDDITKQCIAEITDCKTFHYDESQISIIEEICSKRGIDILQINRDQALVPDSCSVIINRRGTAPALMFETEKNILFSLPGVPFEMRDILPLVLDNIRRRYSQPAIYHRTINTFGLPESLLSTIIESWEENLDRAIKLAYLPNPSLGVRLRLSQCNNMDVSPKDAINKAFLELNSILGDVIYGEENDTLYSVISDFLHRTKQTISVAESCTSGNIAALLTKIPGASKIFKGGVVSYSNESKIDILKVSQYTIDKFGAVSEECVIEMVKGVRRVFNSDYAIATSGVTGPTGGTNEKPIGTLWIAIIGPELLKSHKVQLHGNRELLTEKFSAEALNFMRLNMGIKLY